MCEKEIAFINNDDHESTDHQFIQTRFHEIYLLPKCKQLSIICLEYTEMVCSILGMASVTLLSLRVPVGQTAITQAVLAAQAPARTHR